AARFGGAAGNGDTETAIGQILRKKAADARVVVNDEEMRRVIRERFFFFCCHGVFRSRSDNFASALRLKPDALARILPTGMRHVHSLPARACFYVSTNCYDA